MEKTQAGNFNGATANFSQGDLKCDGMLTNPLTIFACYGPTNGGFGQTTGALSKAVAKVEEDFLGAVAAWPSIKAWLFVHSYVPAAPAQITHKIVELDEAHPDRRVQQFGMPAFRREIEKLPLEDVEELLGAAASDEDFRSLQLPELQALVRELMAKNLSATATDDDPVVVPEEKLSFNNLSHVYQDLIRKGLRNAAEVERYFSSHPVETFSADMASLFKTKYLELKTQDLAPDEIMDEIYDFVLGGQRNTAPRQVAIWNLLAHLFEKCTIFEDHPVSGQTT